MADARALLRQQREARRIDHPHAAYSGAGKLICVLCREHIRAEPLWEAHTRSPAHRKREAATPLGTNSPSGEDPELPPAPAFPKRRLEDDNDGDGDGGDDGGYGEGEAAAWRKRARAAAAEGGEAGHARRKSVTPAQGVEIQIPSRQTSKPASSGSSMSATPQPGVPMTLPVQAGNGAGHPHHHHPPPPPAAASAASASSTPAPAAAPQVDESEWAAFEADIAAASAPYDEDAVISRPAMTADESAAAAEAAAQEAQDAGAGGRRAKADADIEDEREEATRALEEEFDEMQELEARVRRLKEKREALLLRKRDASSEAAADMPDPGLATRRGALGMAGGDGHHPQADDDDEEDEDEDEDDDWNGFRFRTGR
ncbi:Zinc finger protein 830 [Escovopsis weberi]|uniref:Zinc finger protein 830 n=1 Tax=Escovopsis weberi TaxID=150374 RepID=A0A0M8MZU2_ESCWE|nr:Zinc finger protein 830 [Escovopsis weberi]